MCDTDDTDVLVLIPPNFFTIRGSGSEDSLLESSRTVVHKPLSCTAQVIGKLVNQVHCLENRLGSLELSSSDTPSSRTGLSHRKYWEYNQSFDCSTTSNKKYSTYPRRRRRKVSKRVNNLDLSLTLTSLDRSPNFGKPVPPLSLHRREFLDTESPITCVDDTLSMDGDLSSIVSTPSKKNDKLLLHEIDEFLTKVDNYEIPDRGQKSEEANLSSENVIKAASLYMTEKIDSKDDEIKLPSGRVITGNVLDKYIYLSKSEAGSTVHSDRPVQPSDYRHHSNDTVTNKYQHYSRGPDTSKTSQDIKSPSVCKLNFSESSKEIQPTSTPKRLATKDNTGFNPSSNKIYDKATKVLEQYKQNNSSNAQNNTINSSYLTTPKKDEFKIPLRPYNVNYKEGPKLSMLHSKLLDTIDTDLLSLSEMWGDKREGTEKVDSIKLEEERMKREHCESLIQDLQKKLLEQQEKLAVAVKVDRSKDIAISKLREAWTRLTNGLEKTEERHKCDLNKMYKELESYRNIAEGAQKRSQHFEAELYKALGFAHDYQEKCKALKAENSDLQKSMQTLVASKEELFKNKEKEMEMLRENYDTLMRMSKQSADCVRNVEEALLKEKSDHDQTRHKLNDINKQIQTLHDENSSLRQDLDLIREKANEERARCNIHERQLAEKQNQNSELFKKCDTLDQEVKSLRCQLEIQKNDLKVHYQSQLEAAVLAKLAEFQQQLEQAERDIENDSKSKERALVEVFSKQMERIEEQHKLEIKVMEEKHKEEIKLYRLQLAQSSDKISLLESKVSSYRSRRSHIAQQLHGVMQTQWRHALHILTQPNVPGGAVSSQDTAPSPSVEDFKIPSLSIKVPSNRRRESHDIDSFSDTELQNYVKLLLSKPAADLTDDSLGIDQSKDDTRKDINEEPTSDRPDKMDKRDKGKRGVNLNKPPWKS